MRRPSHVYATSLAALVAAILLRYLLDPWLGDTLPLVTLFGAVAATVWIGGAGLSIAVAILGYLACDYLFIQPRGSFESGGLGGVVGLLAYLFTCALIVGIGEAARRAERGRSAQLETARQLASIIDSSEDAIVGKSLDGVIRSWNAAAERMFGYPADQAIGRHISLVIPPDRLDEEDHIITNLKAGRRIEHFETERLRSDGRRIWVSLTISPMKDEAGRIVGASKIARDVTRQREMEDDLRRLAAHLSDADRRKNEFIAMLAHELRNPLAPISNAVRALRLGGGTDPETVRSTAEMLERQVGQMTRLVEDLLDMSRITRGRIELRRQRIELAPVVQQAVEAVRAQYMGLAHELTVSLPPGPLRLDADPARIAQIIANLLNNAAKFTDRGGRVWLTVTEEDGAAIVRVRDTGIGIAAEDLPGIFDMFAQVDASLERSREGLGIGLTLVKTLVDMHGGTVAARSEGPGRGSEFIVRLPLASGPVDAEAPQAPAAGTAAESRRVLIVDDSEDGAESLAILLDLAGHQTWKAHDGIAAVEAAERLRPDVILLDIGLPRLNGYEACRRIRQEPWGRDIVIVALTGWGQEEDRVQSRDAGFDAHMVKPVDHETLLGLLANPRA